MILKTLVLYIISISITTYSVAEDMVIGSAIGIDFSSEGGDTTHWNTLNKSKGRTRSLISTSGQQLNAIEFSWEFDSKHTFNTDGSEDSSEIANQPAFPASALGDWFGTAKEGSITLTFSNLDDSLSYELIIGAANDADNNHADTTWSVNNGTPQTTDASQGEKAYATFSKLSTRDDGTIIIHASSDAFTMVSALQLKAISRTKPKAHALIQIGGQTLILNEAK
ncbi:hypothetical protein [Rubritalea sp.]|uniref:hypothetical protein n=1 Tax=Rubritalea sp. TaxID=2109375 RepID=UPI003EF0B539